MPEALTSAQHCATAAALLAPSHQDSQHPLLTCLCSNHPPQAALRARESGSTRFCMGAAWRGPSQVGDRQWQRVLDMVSQIRGLGMEVCTTLGMLTPEQAGQLREAGLTAYNHNLDTSPEFYEKVRRGGQQQQLTASS